MSGISAKMDVIHLKKEELQFELRFRGIEPGGMAVDAMRSSLRSLLRMEKSNESLHYAEYKFDPNVDYPQISVTYNDLEKLVTDFNEPRSSPAYRRICSRIYHLLGRIDTIPFSEEASFVAGETEQGKSFWIVKVTTLLDTFEQIAIKRERLVSEFQGAGTSAARDSDDDGNVAPRGPEEAPLVFSSPRFGSSASGFHAQSVEKWNVKFTGNTQDLSVVSFLERVNELKVARQVSDHVLFKSAIDLFEGKALLWFRSNGNRCSDWQELSQLLKKHFLPPDYRPRLFQEILARTQGPDEPIVEYLACIRSMFRRHGDIGADCQLDIVTRNLAPFYVMQLPVVNDLEELEAECLKLEIKKYRADNYRDPKCSGIDSVEPELSYSYYAGVSGIKPQTRKPTVIDEVTARAVKLCWRCNKAGHFARNCRANVGLKCFNCGKAGVTKRNCPQCNSSSNQGNAQ